MNSARPFSLPSKIQSRTKDEDVEKERLAWFYIDAECQSEWNVKLCVVSLCIYNLVVCMYYSGEQAPAVASIHFPYVPGVRVYKQSNTAQKKLCTTYVIYNTNIAIRFDCYVYRMPQTSLLARDSSVHNAYNVRNVVSACRELATACCLPSHFYQEFFHLSFFLAFDHTSKSVVPATFRYVYERCIGIFSICAVYFSRPNIAAYYCAHVKDKETVKSSHHCEIKISIWSSIGFE